LKKEKVHLVCRRWDSGLGSKWQSGTRCERCLERLSPLSHGPKNQSSIALCRAAALPGKHLKSKPHHIPLMADFLALCAGVANRAAVLLCQTSSSLKSYLNDPSLLLLRILFTPNSNLKQTIPKAMSRLSFSARNLEIKSFTTQHYVWCNPCLDADKQLFSGSKTTQRTPNVSGSLQTYWKSSWLSGVRCPQNPRKSDACLSVPLLLTVYEGE
jgi:hypothetical protein